MCVVDEKIHVIYSYVMFISYFVLSSKQQYHDLTTYHNSKMFARTSSRLAVNKILNIIKENNQE